MNKKNIFGTLALAAMTTLAFTSCNKQNSQAENKSESNTKAAPTSMKIAYVEVDSIMSQYKFCKDYSLILQKKGQNIQRLQQQTSSKRYNKTPIRASRPKLFRQDCKSRAQTCKGLTKDWATSSKWKPKSIMLLFATVFATSLTNIIRIRSTA